MILIERPTGINDSRYFTNKEFPSNEVPHYTDQLFFELPSKGFVPDAHPERNKAISQNLDILYDLINRRCFVRMNSIVAGISGKKIQKLAIQMIENNIDTFHRFRCAYTEIRPFLMKDLFNDKKLRDYYEDMNGFISNAKLVVDDKKIPKRMPQQDYKDQKMSLGYKQQMRGFMAHLSVKLRLLILALIDSLDSDILRDLVSC